MGAFNWHGSVDDVANYIKAWSPNPELHLPGALKFARRVRPYIPPFNPRKPYINETHITSIDLPEGDFLLQSERTGEVYSSLTPNTPPTPSEHFTYDHGAFKIGTYGLLEIAVPWVVATRESPSGFVTATLPMERALVKLSDAGIDGSLAKKAILENMSGDSVPFVERMASIFNMDYSTDPKVIAANAPVGAHITNPNQNVIFGQLAPVGSGKHHAASAVLGGTQVVRHPNELIGSRRGSADFVLMPRGDFDSWKKDARDNAYLRIYDYIGYPEGWGDG